MRRILTTLIVTTLALAGGASAQVGMMRPLPAPSPAVAQPITVAPDPAKLAQDLSALRSRVAKLETDLSAMRSDLAAVKASAVFTCVDRQTSRNGAGVTEDCGPYACNPMDGRCRTTAATSDHCAGGYSWCVLYNSCTTVDGCH